MKIIKGEEVVSFTNSERSRVSKYSFGDSDIDIDFATIVGRCPEVGFCVNLVAKN